jgi:ribonucleoside-diphosphate reductase alpha chain
LGSINLARHTGARGVDFEKLAQTVELAVRQLDRVIDINYYPIGSARASNMRWRPVGLGVMGLQDVFFALRLAFDSQDAQVLSTQIAEHIYFHALRTSMELARQSGPHDAFPDTRAARGELQFDAWGTTPVDSVRWERLREEIKVHGLRNSLLIAIAPTATIASIAGCYECIEPQLSNLFKRETLSGDFVQMNRYLVEELKTLDQWNDATRSRLKVAEGSVQEMTELPASLLATYRTAWEIPMRSLIDMAADRGAFIDQSQSLNLFIENPNIGQLSSMYFYAWKKGLKTTYYLRSRPATRIAKATVETPAETRSTPEGNPRSEHGWTPVPPAVSEAAGAKKDAAAVACSLENPESCEACQ